MSRFIDADAIRYHDMSDGQGMWYVWRDEIHDIPTADVVEVVHAEWIKNWEIGWSACSHCGKGYLWEDYKGVADWKYCPNCGAKIDSRRER